MVYFFISFPISIFRKDVLSTYLHVSLYLKECEKKKKHSAQRSLTGGQADMGLNGHYCEPAVNK